MLSIIIPSYNEEQNIKNTAKTVLDIMDRAEIDCELVFVSDGSKDNTFDIIHSLSLENPQIKGIEFSRNFGKEAAIFAGLSKGNGDCFVVMDCDLQHPPETIVEMYRLWEQGYEIIEGVKNTRGNESVFHKALANTFYKILSSLTGFDMKNTSDFKLLDKKVVNVLCSMPERKTFFRALTFWTGFQSTTVCYDVAERNLGTSKWSGKSLLRYAISNIISFSSSPLNIVTYLGVISVLFGIIIGIQTLVRFFIGAALGGFTTVILLMLILCGCILIGLGLIGKYLAAMYDEIKKRPKYIIEKDTDDMRKGNSSWIKTSLTK
ncbi:MAG: glycosyltransferase family 2 protein [Clostridia bacterium]|nr:glycosyltransferase family 2 protein [Clostridia bacterium]